ncbi:MAG: amylosucrase, partial [Lachnospiraceae bacterium]|nr:amylosucrase [Lachnospiraceae bacterium]
ERAHKKYLNDYFQGYDGGSNSRGELYNADPVTGDARFCGTTASMCGVEKAAFEKDTAALKKAVKMDLMLHAYMFMQSGIPVLYSGDEIGQLNDYHYKEDADKAPDSRYIHRGPMDWKLAEQLRDTDTVAGMIFQGLKQLETIRKAQKVFVSYADTWTVDTGDASVLCIGRYLEGETLYGIFNFNESDRTARLGGVDGDGTDLITGEKKNLAQMEIPAYGYFYLKK